MWRGRAAEDTTIFDDESDESKSQLLTPTGHREGAKTELLQNEFLFGFGFSVGTYIIRKESGGELYSQKHRPGNHHKSVQVEVYIMNSVWQRQAKVLRGSIAE